MQLLCSPVLPGTFIGTIFLGCFAAVATALCGAYGEGGELTLAFVVISNCASVIAGVIMGVHWVWRTGSTGPPSPPSAHLHWDPAIQRRGIGDLLTSVNHVALIVSDVGRSLAFYVEIMGFQQIQRPNFDRHGAWLTMGNIELHLIKGVPNAPSGRDLIVSHIALDTEHPAKVLERLIELNVPFRQNISVPDPDKARNNKVECFENSDGKVSQFFIRDPDGYYLELCDCDILTKFCLFKEAEEEAKKDRKRGISMDRLNWILGTYNESGQAPAPMFRCAQLFKVGIVIKRHIARIRAEMVEDPSERLARRLSSVQRAAEADEDILQNFIGRTKTYCDITQGFVEADFAKALCASGNSAPLAVLILMAQRRDKKVYLPPQYLLSEGGRIKQQVFQIDNGFAVRMLKSIGTQLMFASKPFQDNVDQGPAPSGRCTAGQGRSPKSHRVRSCRRSCEQAKASGGEDEGLSPTSLSPTCRSPAWGTSAFHLAEYRAPGKGRRA